MYDSVCMCVCICMYVCIYMCVYVCIYIYILLYILLYYYITTCIITEVMELFSTYIHTYIRTEFVAYKLLPQKIHTYIQTNSSDTYNTMLSLYLNLFPNYSYCRGHNKDWEGIVTHSCHHHNPQGTNYSLQQFTYTVT